MVVKTMPKFHTVSKENQSIFPKSRIQSDDNEQFLKCAEEWISYYRENPHRYCVDVLGIHLKEFQQILMCGAFYNDYIMYIAARG